MNTGQMLLAIGALALLSGLALTMNGIMLDGNRTMMETDLYVVGTSVAQSFIEQAAVLKFDVAVGSTNPSMFPGGFTSPYGLGPMPGETYPNFNDADDFNGYSGQVDAGHVTFDVDITVNYCTSNGTFSSSRTYYKLMQVTVSSPFIPTDIVHSRILAYTM